MQPSGGTVNLNKLKTQLLVEEGSPSHTYLDSEGILTGGVGHNLQAHPAPSFTKVGVPVPQTVAAKWLEDDIAAVVKDLNKWLPWWKDLDDPRQNAVADMTFNLGIGNAEAGTGLLGFRNTLLLLREGDYMGAAANIKSSLYARQVGRRASRIAGMIAYGVWPDDIPFDKESS